MAVQYDLHLTCLGTSVQKRDRSFPAESHRKHSQYVLV